LPPITALSTIAIINNRPCIWGDGAVALIQSRNIVERWVETTEGNEQTAQAIADEYGELDYTPSQRDFLDDYTAVCTIWRKGQSEPYVGRFSVRDARRAGLWTNPKKKPWFEHPKRMLQWRARAYAMRDGFSDCLMGLAIREEVEDLTPEPVTTDTSFLDDAVLEPESVDQKALPSPTEEALPGIVIEGEKPKEVVEVQATQQGADMVLIAQNQNSSEASKAQAPEAPKGQASEPTNAQAPEIPSVEIHKPMGAKKANWVRTREALTTAFQELPTVAACALFRAKNSGTINQLRTNAKDEWDVFNDVAASYERTLYEQEHPNTTVDT
ncbi:MAG TPA: hypothetical protein VGI36_13085, partial [Candidatus Binataceae bacterium]